MASRHGIGCDGGSYHQHCWLLIQLSISHSKMTYLLSSLNMLGWSPTNPAVNHSLVCFCNYYDYSWCRYLLTTCFLHTCSRSGMLNPGHQTNVATDPGVTFQFSNFSQLTQFKAPGIDAKSLIPLCKWLNHSIKNRVGHKGWRPGINPGSTASVFLRLSI